MQRSTDDGSMVAIGFIGTTLGPLFLYEPFAPQNVAIYQAFAEMDAKSAALDWPFAAPSTVERALQLLIDNITRDKGDGLTWEYRRLFVGPALKAAPPWGSVYTDKDQVIFGASTLKLRQWMRENGVVKQVPEGEPEDHIGLLLMMMAWLATNKPDVLPAFLQDHLLTWAPHFLKVLEETTIEPFFAGLASLTKESLLAIQASLELEVSEPRFYR